MKMYDQMFNDIDRHHKVVWQVIGVLVGSLAFVALAIRNIVPIDIAISLVVILTLWVIAHVYDSNYWYNRNLVIISNIERQFLNKEDLKRIHYYFGEHRDKNSIQTSLKIQLYFCYAIASIFLIYHFITQILDGFYICSDLSDLKLIKLLPYLSFIGMYISLNKWIKKKRINDYQEFSDNSPGIDIDTEGIKYGGGHPANMG